MYWEQLIMRRGAIETQKCYGAKVPENLTMGLFCQLCRIELLFSNFATFCKDFPSASGNPGARR